MLLDPENPIFPSISFAANKVNLPSSPRPDPEPLKFICTDHQSLLKKGKYIEIKDDAGKEWYNFNVPQVSYGDGIDPE